MMPLHKNQSINTATLNSMTISRKTYKDLLNDFKKMQTLAVNLKQMYELLDKRHHELTYITIQMEKHFSELFELVYHCRPDKYSFKSTIDSICKEKEQVDQTFSRSFFK